jgi:uncharacterized protein (DUF934 family)
MRPERVIRERRIVRNAWTLVGVASADELALPLPAGPVAVPLAYWHAHAAALRARGEPIGVWLKPEDDPATLAADVAALPLIAVHFPKFADGRGYSTAVLLRKRLGFTGELLAFGDVGRDQLLYLRRVGFTTFSLPPHRDLEDALAAFDELHVRYQGAVDDALPLFRKRLAAGAPR